jgi:hypothetical protein
LNPENVFGGLLTVTTMGIWMNVKQVPVDSILKPKESLSGLMKILR